MMYQGEQYKARLCSLYEPAAQMADWIWRKSHGARSKLSSTSAVAASAAQPAAAFACCNAPASDGAGASVRYTRPTMMRITFLRGSAAPLVSAAFVRAVGCLIALIVLAFQSSMSAQAVEAGENKWSPWIGSGVFYGSDNDSRGEAGLFVPFWQEARALAFFDVRGKLFKHDINEVNAAIGYRSMMDSGWNLGGWFGIDTRKTRIENRFWQFAAGIEALHPDWDIRANVYSSLTDPQSSPELTELRLSGNQLRMVGGNEVGLSGFDGEVGARVPLQRIFGESTQQHELRLYAGGFHFDDSKSLQDVTGPKVRAVWKINEILDAMPGSNVALRARYTYDEVRDSRWEVGLKLSIPLSATKRRKGRRFRLSAQQRRMTEGLERDTDIVTARSAREPVVDSATGTPLDSVTIVNGGTLQTALDAAGEQSLIVVQGDFGTGATLQSGQTLLSGGSSIEVRGISTQASATYTAPGDPARVTHTPNSAALVLASNTHVRGLTLQGAGAGGGNVGISGTGDLSNVVLDGNVVDDFGGTGISLTNVTGSGALRIANNAVRRAGADGIRFGVAGSANISASIDSNTVENAALDGIQVTAFNSGRLDLSMTGNVVRTAGADNVRFDLQNDSMTNLLFDNNTLSSAASDGIEFDIENNASLVATISNNTLGPTTFGEGIEIDQDQSSQARVQIVGNSIINSFADPLDIDLDNNSSGQYQVVRNQFNSPQPASIIDIDTNDNATLDVQAFGNSSTVNFDFDEDGASAFQLEDTLTSNTLTGGAALVIDLLIGIVPAGSFFAVPSP